MKQLTTALFIFAGFFFAIPNEAHAGEKVWPACLSDEGESRFNCVWDSKHQGNGEGHSFFINRKGVHLISHARAHNMINR